jgi:HlyD family secretion protein
MKKGLLIGTVLALILGTGAWLLLGRGRDNPDGSYKTARVERGPLVSTVSATGNLTPVVTVQVGTQVSGMIARIFVDYNSPVKKGQPIAEIDPTLFRAQLEQARGNYLAAQANVEKARVTLADAKRTMRRNAELLGKKIISQGDFDTVETTHDAAVAALAAAQAAVVQMHGSLLQAQANLDYTSIRSPVDGIVVSRSVDVGQTVAASFQTPTLFNIAQDLTQMEILSSVDEADISKIREGQAVSFTVDAYPERRFEGRVAQVRNAPVTSSNVVTYVAVVSLDNGEMLLKPGMTANVTFEVGRREDALKVPKAALRFKPKSADAKAQATEARPGKVGQTVHLLGQDGRPTPVAIRTGMGSDTHVEVLEGALKEGDEVVVEQVAKRKAGSGMPHGPKF